MSGLATTDEMLCDPDSWVAASLSTTPFKVRHERDDAAIFVDARRAVAGYLCAT
jgi:hypothetical protein